MERDFYQLQARAPRNEPDTFRQGDDGLEMTTLNGVSGTVQLERVRWRLEEGRLYRDVWPVIDSPADARPDAVPIVGEVKSLQWRLPSGLAKKLERPGTSAGWRRADADDGKRGNLALGVYDAGRYPEPPRQRPQTHLPRHLQRKRHHEGFT